MVEVVAPSSAASSRARIGRYEVLARLAAGGMAEILLGRVHGPSGFERAVVIKRILPQYAELPTFVSMFLDEARIAARIHHPNVVQVHELGEEDGALFLVMEYLQGESSAGLMRRIRSLGRLIEPAIAAHVVAEACAGLHAAHELKGPTGESMNLVHRDVSPQNLFITYDGGVKVLDFGIAKAADRISQTEAGTLKGKFEYMSPEQAEGLSLDRRSDIFALGVVLYELSTGRRLFKRGSAVESLRAVREGLVTPPSRVIEGYPARLEEICLRALATDPAERYPTAADMRRDLVFLTRELSSERLPSETLARTMQELFASRVEEKRRVLESVKARTAIGAVPAAEVDVAVDIPAVEVEEVDARPTRAFDPPRRRSRTALTVAAWLVAVGVLATAVALFGPGDGATADDEVADDEVATDVTPSAAHPEPAAEAPIERSESPATVLLRIESTPAGAAIVIDGEPRGETPAEIRLPQSDEELALRLSREGHQVLERTIRPQVSQLLQLDLARARQRSTRRPRTSEAEPARPVFRRFE